MNPSLGLFIKLSILLSLSLQVYASEFSNHSPALASVEDELKILRHQRRQLQRRQEVTPTDKAQKEAGAAQTEGVFQNAKLSKEEELAGRMFETILQMGSGLESVTNLASSTKEIVEHSQKVAGLVPQLNTLTNELVSAVPTKANELAKSSSATSEAGAAIVQSLKAIEEKAEDANVIKANFKTLEKSFHTMLSAADTVAIAAIPKLAQLFKEDEEKAAAQQNQAGEKAELKASEKKSAGNNAPETKGAEPKAPELKAAEQKALEPAQPQNNAEPKTVEPKVAEPKAIEPIVPDVVVPQQ